MSFDKKEFLIVPVTECLNPFRAGRCLSTLSVEEMKTLFSVLIPFEQGDVFRQGVVFKKDRWK